MSIAARQLAAVVAAALSVAGCATPSSTPHPSPPPPSTRAGCPSGAGADDRCIDVFVISVGGQPQIQPIADEAMQRQGAIWWTIRTPGYTFPLNGIDFANPGTPPPGSPPKTLAGGEITGCTQMPPANTRYKCINHHRTNSPATGYGYKVTVSGTPAVPSLDPFIINN